jgi:hypothetical protein
MYFEPCKQPALNLETYKNAGWQFIRFDHLISFLTWLLVSQNCRVLIKAYEMNPLLHFPVYSLAIPLLLAYAVYKTRSIQ